MPGSAIVVSAAVEGVIDEVVLRKLCTTVGLSLGSVYGRKGKAHVLQNLRGYNYSARFRHWIVLLDLDNDASCAPEVLPNWLPAPSPLMCLRIAVREIESWILADRERFASYLGVPSALLPLNPETVADPKQTIVNLGRRSRRKAIREDLVPLEGSGQPVGPAYTSRMVEFIQDQNKGWRPEIAANSCASLQRCIQSLTRFIESAPQGG